MPDHRRATMRHDDADHVETHRTMPMLGTRVKSHAENRQMKLLRARDRLLRTRRLRCARLDLHDHERPAVGRQRDDVGLVPAELEIRVQDSISESAQVSPGASFASFTERAPESIPRAPRQPPSRRADQRAQRQVGP